MRGKRSVEALLLSVSRSAVWRWRQSGVHTPGFDAPLFCCSFTSSPSPLDKRTREGGEKVWILRSLSFLFPPSARSALRCLRIHLSPQPAVALRLFPLSFSSRRPCSASLSRPPLPACSSPASPS
ncbi:hypothetical protein TGVAND_313090 [Toxoplasma gondii VAND]|uniref:Uncharacterized protein n=3 Tax=Toxoplasma gondii TaxID=5811 RepID=A0A086QZ00_TOXGO|nr:hypothetical protein TGP89_313090 [Toxoplasma gondii p89]KFH09765.1 hypothetical protein TGVAND_313090 [Toxoplasma gondii VAND]KFH17832.1 hypothetical protein TGMAS_313090 [Toxoplasma gondii MAS]